MKKLFLSGLVMFALSGAFAQGKIMAGAGFGILAPLCTNCSAFVGGNISGQYAIIDKLAVGVELGRYSYSNSVYDYSVFAAGATANFYPKGSYKGFFVGADLTALNLTQKYTGGKVTGGDFTAAANIGWAIAIGEKFRIIPHIGMGTWNSGWKGRLNTGLKVGFRI